MIGGNGEVVVAFSIRESQDWRIAVQASWLDCLLLYCTDLFSSSLLLPD